ncbi:ClpP protease complex subunit Peptidase S14 [Klebsormidium nitens]|uniref:ATP-dependent Clp protease proteolytic subunit n=1 Tax=Klebsormidium nitens TaxID=105231 RepID=A0A0U9HL63_KLENI|nr:ClpP protease complex subunit Peptidase S14 [Klebsormidium nitens]|eukprot:GAQ87296.1 ClpP protease complex subunit Peptidase S14 [Klebsormidium nitens]
MGRKLPVQRRANAPDRICMAGGMTSSGGILLPPFDNAYMDLAKKYGNAKFPAPYAPQMGAASPAQVERGGGGSSGQHKSRRPPPDLPSLLLNSRIVYIGMPLVPAVTELIIAEILYLQWIDGQKPIHIYINSTGTARADGETVGMETEGFAIYDAMQNVKNEVHTLCIGCAIGQAALLLSAGKKNHRFMLPHSTAMIQQPRAPGGGLMPAIDVYIRARETVKNRDTLVRLLSYHTRQNASKVSKDMERPLYMRPEEAIAYGLADHILDRDVPIAGDTKNLEDWDKGAGIRVVQRPATAGQPGLG